MLPELKLLHNISKLTFAMEKISSRYIGAANCQPTDFYSLPLKFLTFDLNELILPFNFISSGLRLAAGWVASGPCRFYQIGLTSASRGRRWVVGKLANTNGGLISQADPATVPIS